MTGDEQLLAALETERRRLEVILRQMPAMVLVFGADGRIVRANDQYLAAVGMSADEVIGSHARDLPTQVVDDAGRTVPPEELPSTRALRGEDVNTEVGIEWPSGQRWFQVSGAPIRGDGGTLDGAVLTMRDITVERESAAALRASEARHRALLDAMPDTLYRIRRDGVVLERRAPDDGRAVLRDDYAGVTLDDLLGAETGGRLRDAIERTFETGQPCLVEYERPGPGETYYREARMVALGSDQVLSLVRDIGERKRAEHEREQLLETIDRDRRRLDAILRQLPNALIVFDTNGQIVHANDALIATLKLPKEQVIGRHSSELGTVYLTPDGRALTREELPSSHAFRGEEFDGELRVERAGGRNGWIHVSAAPVRDEHGTITGVILATRDITAERQAVEALRASEERNRALLDAIPDSLYVNDRDGLILDFKPPNDGRPMLFGPDSIGRRVGELWPPEVADAIIRMTNAALDSGQVQIREYEVPTPVGHGHREARVVPYGGDRTLALVRDIDARKRAEHERERLLVALERERRRLDAILRQVPHSLIVLDREGTIVDVNDGFAAINGVPKAEIVGRHSGSIGRRYLDDDGRELSWEELPSSRALRGEDVECELRAVAGDETHAWLHVSAAPVRDEAGTITGAIVSTHDITAEREAVEALRRSEEQNRALLDAIPDSLYVTDRDGWIVDFRPPSDGRPMAEVTYIGRHVREITTPELATRLLDAARDAHESGKIRGIEYETAISTGDVYREARMVPYGADLVLTLVRDVDARKRAELALQALNEELEQRVRDRTAQLEAANAELEAFSYSVSHDLKAPLRGIDGYSRLLWEDYQDRLDDDGRYLLGSVRQATAQMHQLIDDLLAYSRLERRAVDGNEIELLPIVEGLLAERAEEIRSRDVHLDVSVPDITVRADRDGLAQAFRNLLDNALRFTADVPKPRIEITTTVEPARCVLSVRDNGIGFDMQYHDRIFEIFQRLHRQEEYPGTGIGLALVRKAMQRMGGRAWAESSPGAGAAFFLELPR